MGGGRALRAGLYKGRVARASGGGHGSSLPVVSCRALGPEGSTDEDGEREGQEREDSQPSSFYHPSLSSPSEVDPFSRTLLARH